MNQRGFVIPSPMMLMICAIALLFAGNLLFYSLWQGAKDDLRIYIAEVDAANAKIAADNAALVARLTRQAADIQVRYERDLGTIRSDYSSRLRGANRRCAVVSGASATARLVDAATSDYRLDPTGQASEFERACIRLETDAAVTTLQLLHLQDWALKLK